MFSSVFSMSDTTKLDDDDEDENADVEAVQLPQTPIVEFMTETTRAIVKKSAGSPSSKKENESENLTHLTLMSKNQQRRHWETKQGRASFVRKMSQRKISPIKSPRFKKLSVVTSPDSKNEDFDLTAPMTSTFHHAIQSSRHIAADALMKMTTTGFAKEDVMFRTSSPERKKRKGRRRAIRWFRSPTRGDSAKKSMKTYSSETSILNKIGRQLFGESSSSRRSGGRDGKDVSNVSVHHETPVHLLPEEQLFADPSTQWVVEEYWKRLTLQTRLWLLLKRSIFLFFACFYAIITVGPLSALATGSYVESGVATRLVDEELEGFPTKFFFDVDDLEELYLYVEGPMFDAFFNSEHTIGESSELYETSNRTKHIATFNRLVGSVRVRVVRSVRARSARTSIISLENQVSNAKLNMTKTLIPTLEHRYERQSRELVGTTGVALR